VLVDDELIHAFYDAQDSRGHHHPGGLRPLAARGGKANPKLLCLEKEQLMRHEAAGITTDAFPARAGASRPAASSWATTTTPARPTTA
jgi:ATP-dependent helicase HrpA